VTLYGLNGLGVQILAGVIDFFSCGLNVQFLNVKPSGTSSNQ